MRTLSRPEGAQSGLRPALGHSRRPNDLRIQSGEQSAVSGGGG